MAYSTRGRHPKGSVCCSSRPVVTIINYRLRNPGLEPAPFYCSSPIKVSKMRYTFQNRYYFKTSTHTSERKTCKSPSGGRAELSVNDTGVKQVYSCT